MQINPRLDPDTTHPIVLFEDLYGEDPRAPQTQFVLDRQIAFLEQLAACGSVRAAARRVKVSHQTCYRARRNSAAFGRAWDAALVVARASAEAQLGEWALHGRREDVWYHGEIVGQRTIYSDRLILAHLARLDRLRTDERIERMAENFDAMLQRMRRGEGIEPSFDAQNSVHAEPVGLAEEAQPQPGWPGSNAAAGIDPADQLRFRQAQPERGSVSGDREGDTWDAVTAENLASGQWSMRSMSPASSSGEGRATPHQSVRPEPVSRGDSCASEGLHFTSSDGAEERTAVQPAAVLRNRQAQPERSEGGEGPPSSSGAVGQQECPKCGGLCDTPFATLTEADCMWFGHRLQRMFDAVPEGVERATGKDLGPDDWGIDELHIDAFECGLDQWWLIESEEELEARIAGTPDDGGPRESPEGEGEPEADGAG